MLAAVAALVAVPLQAMAAGPDDHASDRASAAQERRAALMAAKEAAMAAFHEARQAALADYHAALQALKDSFHENRTRILEECRPVAHSDAEDAPSNNSGMANLSKEERLAFAHCIHDQMGELKNATRAAMREAREAAHDALQAARQAALDAFRQARADWDAEHGPA